MTDWSPLIDRDVVELREGLIRGGIVGAHSFIRELNSDYDREIRIDDLLKPVSTEDDLRISFGDGSNERWVLMRRLDWDSTFFGYGIARLDVVIDPRGPVDLRTDARNEVAAIKKALALARRRGVTYVFAVAQAADLAFIRSLARAGFELIETRLYYHRSLTEPAERFPMRLATRADIPSLARAAVQTRNQFDRFHADPAIIPADADRLMEEWVRASIEDNFADATIVPDVEEPEAFCTAKYHREHWAGWGLKLSQPVLSAVSKRHRGSYVRIISELDEHLRSIGAEHSFLATQVTNNAVIRSWEKLGYQFGKGEHVMRILL